MSHAPSPAAAPLLGHARVFRKDPLGFLLRSARAHGPVVRLQLGPLIYHLITGPREVEQVLTEKASNYRRDTRSSRNIKLVTGESLLTTEGEEWRKQRKMAQPIFHHHRLAALCEMMIQATRQVADEWKALSGPVDLAAEMNRLTFMVVGRCLFGAELGGRAGVVEKAMPPLLAELFRRAGQPFAFPLWLPTKRHRVFKDALRSINEVVGEVISTHRGSPGDSPDLLGLLLKVRDDDGQPLTDLEIRNHTITFLLAGHETTASALTWALCLLDQHPEVREKVEAELTRELSGAAPTLENLPRLQLLDAVLRETLRLYPSIWIAERSVVADDFLGGFEIPEGSTVILSAYVTQRIAAYWDDPDTFDPGRFIRREELPSVGDGYMPFGAGPHVCIGQHFAMMEAKLVLAMLLQRFRVSRLDSAFPSMLGGITLRPEKAVPALISARAG